MHELKETVQSMEGRINEQEKIIQKIRLAEEKIINETERSLKVDSYIFTFKIKTPQHLTL